MLIGRLLSWQQFFDFFYNVTNKKLNMKQGEEEKTNKHAFNFQVLKT